MAINPLQEQPANTEVIYNINNLDSMQLEYFVNIHRSG